MIPKMGTKSQRMSIGGTRIVRGAFGPAPASFSTSSSPMWPLEHPCRHFQLFRLVVATRIKSRLREHCTYMLWRRNDTSDTSSTSFGGVSHRLIGVGVEMPHVSAPAHDDLECE